jgi:hypothetical protein
MMTSLNVSRTFQEPAACPHTQIALHQIHLVLPCLLAIFSLASYTYNGVHFDLTLVQIGMV